MKCMVRLIKGSPAFEVHKSVVNPTLLRSSLTAIIISQSSFLISAAFTLTSLEYVTGLFNFILLLAIFISLSNEASPTTLNATPASAKKSTIASLIALFKATSVSLTQS